MLNVPLVVVAEADRLAADLLCGYLDANGLRAEAARDGVQAYLKTLRLRPDVLVTDLWLPRVDGFELVSRLRADERARRVPIVAIHDGSIEGVSARAASLGISRVLAGPVELAEMLEQVNDVLRESKRLRREANGKLQRVSELRARWASLIGRANHLIVKSRLLLDRQHLVE